MVSTALRLHDVSVTLGRTEIVHQLSLDFDAGGWSTIIGPNGAGKSTLLRALGGLIAHDGQISGSGGATTQDRQTWARTVGYLAQHPVLPPGMTVLDYVLLGRTPHHGLFGAPGAPDMDRVATMLDRFDLVALAERTIASVSGGEAQRAALARVMVQEAPILLLDEPTTGLDLGHQQELLDLLGAVRAEHGVTIIATQHDLTIAGRYGDRLLMLDNGTIVADGDAAEVLTPQRLFDTYGARVEILDLGDGPVVIPKLSDIQHGAVPDERP